MSALEKAAAGDPDNAVYQNDLGVALDMQGRNAEARDWLQRIVGKRAVLSGPLLRAQKPWIAKAEKKLADIPA